MAELSHNDCVTQTLPELIRHARMQPTVQVATDLGPRAQEAVGYVAGVADTLAIDGETFDVTGEPNERFGYFVITITRRPIN